MSAQTQPVRLLEPEAAAQLLGLARRSLANWRSQGRGPRYIKTGGRVRYRTADLERWLDRRAVDPEARQ